MRPEKESIIQEIRNNTESAGFVILTNYHGLSVEQMTELRGRLRENDSKMSVVKNSFLVKACGELGWDALPSMLDGPTAMIYGNGDVANVAKTLKNYIRANNNKPVLRGGRISGKSLSCSEVEQLADLPSREIMLGILVGTVAAPMTRVVGVLNQKLLSLLHVLKAIEDKKSQG